MANSTVQPGTKGWLFGPASDLLLGCGLAYLVIALANGLTGPALALAVPGGVLVLLLSLPHYGATLLRVYEDVEERNKYRFFALHVTAALALAFVVGLNVSVIGSLAVTIYLTWSPWHYTGQNYGVALMLLGRRGVVLSAGAKRLVWGSFVASYLLTLLAIHGSERQANYAPVASGETVFQLIPLGVPYEWSVALIAFTAVAYVALLVGAVAVLLRAASTVRDIGPALLLMGTQGLWFSVPVLLRLGGGIGAEQAAFGPFSAYGFLWIAGAHSAQYLWITAYFATRSENGAGKLRFLGKAALAGYAVWTLPGLLFAPGLLGRVPYDAGLALLIASFVNLHHFILDGAVWKLRDGRVSRVLLRSEPLPISADRQGAGSARWLRGTIWALGVVSVGVALVGFWESEFGFRRAIADGRLARAEIALERFAMIGREAPQKRIEVARAFSAAGNSSKAIEHLEKSIEVGPTHLALHSLGVALAEEERWNEALEVYEEAFALRPDSIDTLYRRGLARLEVGNAAGAAADFERLLTLRAQHDPARVGLARARIALRQQSETSALE